MLRAYFDAGETSRGHRNYYMGGYVAPENSWVTFNRTWRRLLRDNDLEFFHMTDYVARQGRYKAWSESQRLGVMKRIVTYIGRTATLGVSAAVSMADYAALTPESKKLIGTPYSICAGACVGRVARRLRDLGINQRVAYVFELGDAGQGAVKNGMANVFSDPRHRERYLVQCYDFKSKRTNALGLQAADVLAFETGRFVPRAIRGDTSQALRKSFEALLVGVRHSGVLFAAKELDGLVKANRDFVEALGQD